MTTPADVSGFVYVLDTYRDGAIGVPAPEANGPAYLERTYLTFEEIEGVNQRDYKVIERIDVIGRVPGETPIEVRVASVDAPGEAFVFGDDSLDFDGTVGTRQLDYRSAGRYHALRIDYSDVQAVRISGLDIDVSIAGSRG